MQFSQIMQFNSIEQHNDPNWVQMIHPFLS